MKKPKIALLSLVVVIVLIFMFFLTGCELFDSGYRFEFRVQNSAVDDAGSIITMIEFINGSNENAPVLHTEMPSLPGGGQMSSTYKVSGFTEKYDDERCIFGVRITFIGGYTIFKHSYAADNGKILVKFSYFLFPIIEFSSGKW